MEAGTFSDVRRTLYYIGILAVIVWGIHRVSRIGMRPKNYPPGPPTLPIIGNLHQLPKKDLHLAYDRWAKQYGPIYSLKLGQTTVIVLANGDVIKKLVDKRGGNYADRQDIYMRGLWDDSRIIMRGYDDLWKVERKLYHNFLNINMAKKYYPYQEFETIQLLADFLRDPADFVNHISRTTSSIGSSMTYGFRLTSMDNRDIKELNRNSHGFFEMVLQTKLLDWYPFLRPLVKLLPRKLNSVALKAADYYRRETIQFNRLFAGVKNRDNGTDALPCFAHDIAKSQLEWKGTLNGNLLTDHAASYIAGISFEGGADTTRNTLIGFVKAMALFQDAQAEAHAELDRIIGSERMPRIEDSDILPYIRCVIKESLRWMPVAITGAIPHAPREDDEYEGYHIPKGAGIVMAVWSANNDTDLFQNPRLFNPSRHSPTTSLFESAASSDYRNRDSWTFGAGRRMCPGMHVAEKTLFISIARILWAFSIMPEKDGSGHPIYIHPDEVTQSLAACPLPFKCQIVPRDAARAELVKSEWASASTLLKSDGNYSKNILK